MKKIFIIIATFAISCLAIAQQHLTTGEYWFDSNYNSRTILGVTPSAGFLFNSGIDCNTLGTGLHVINLRFRQTGGQWSNTVSQLFLKTPQAFSNSIAACEYWLDNNYSGRMSQAVTPSATLNLQTAIDFAGISTGVHVFNIRFRQSNGAWSSVSSQIFTKVSPETGSESQITLCEYWLDDSYETKVSQPVSPTGNYTLISGIDFSTVAGGNHEFNIRFKQSNGAWSSVISQIFVKTPLEIDNNTLVSYEYWLDNDYNSRITQAIAPASTFFFASEIDLSSVSAGIHSFNMRFRQSNNTWTGAVSQMFLMQPVTEGSNLIVAYEYWFNEHFDQRTPVSIAPGNIYTAISNPNIDNSDRFLNIFHARFRDANNSYTYVDEYFYSIDLSLTLLLENLYEDGFMRKAQNEAGDNFPGTIADTVTVQIREGTAPYKVLLNFHGVELNTDGSCQLQQHGNNFVNLPDDNNTTFYMVIKHRNSVETWSQAVPIVPESSYNFTDSETKAYGNNLKAANGVYLIFGGDVNQDGVVDTADITPVDNDSGNYLSGYLVSDVNGDGIVDTGDMTIVDNNAATYVGTVIP